MIRYDFECQQISPQEMQIDAQACVCNYTTFDSFDLAEMVLPAMHIYKAEYTFDKDDFFELMEIVRKGPEITDIEEDDMEHIPETICAILTGDISVRQASVLQDELDNLFPYSQVRVASGYTEESDGINHLRIYYLYEDYLMNNPILMGEKKIWCRENKDFFETNDNLQNLWKQWETKSSDLMIGHGAIMEGVDYKLESIVDDEEGWYYCDHSISMEEYEAKSSVPDKMRWEDTKPLIYRDFT